jgi:hypothetical protein
VRYYLKLMDEALAKAGFQTARNAPLSSQDGPSNKPSEYDGRGFPRLSRNSADEALIAGCEESPLSSQDAPFPRRDEFGEKSLSFPHDKSNHGDFPRLSRNFMDSEVIYWESPKPRDKRGKLFAVALEELRAKPPEGILNPRWVPAIKDAGDFLAAWGEQASALGWSADDLFGLHPTAPLARYDHMGSSGSCMAPRSSPSQTAPQRSARRPVARSCFIAAPDGHHAIRRPKVEVWQAGSR